MDLNAMIATINNFVWGPVMLLLFVGTGIFLTVRLKFLPWRNLAYSIRTVFRRGQNTTSGDISPFQSLMTALAATIGTGNIVGVATAMVLGGPGALVWMWISALFGLSTKYGESVLSVKYRRTNSIGEMSGGPMYVMKHGFKNKTIGKYMAGAFATFGVLSSFGIGNMTQSNSIATAVHAAYDIPTWIVGIAIMILSLSVLLRGIKTIANVCNYVIPFMALFYVAVTLIVVVANAANIPAGLSEIFRMAFAFDSVAGGVGGALVANMMSAMRWGVARGVFSNESGLGTAPIAAAAARTDHPSRQGYVNMTGTFFDTMIICMMTGLLISSSGMLGVLDPATGKPLTGVTLTMAAFGTVFGESAKTIVAISLGLFAYSTILGWEYYGEKCLEYLLPVRKVLYAYRVLFSALTYVGATTALDIVWNISDTTNGLMAVPNLICLLVLSKEIAKECFEFQTLVVEKEKAGEIVNLEEVPDAVAVD